MMIPYTDHLLTLRTADELMLVQPTAIGHSARQYLLHLRNTLLEGEALGKQAMELLQPEAVRELPI